jgi:hypothetical protein
MVLYPVSVLELAARHNDHELTQMLPDLLVDLLTLVALRQGQLVSVNALGRALGLSAKDGQEVDLVEERDERLHAFEFKAAAGAKAGPPAQFASA